MKLVCKKEVAINVETYSIIKNLNSSKEESVIIEITDRYVEVPRINMSSKLIEEYTIKFQKAYFSKVGDEYGLVLFTDSDETLGFFNNDDGFYDLYDLNLLVIKSFTQLEGYSRVVFQKCNKIADWEIELLCMYYRFLTVRNDCIKENNPISKMVLEAMENIGIDFTDYQSMLKGYLTV